MAAWLQSSILFKWPSTPACLHEKALESKHSRVATVLDFPIQVLCFRPILGTPDNGQNGTEHIVENPFTTR